VWGTQVAINNSIINVKFASNVNPIVLKNQTPNLSTAIKGMSDVVLDNPTNNSVLIYNSSDQEFHLDQLSLDGGNF
jgi:hypothetical protein